MRVNYSGLVIAGIGFFLTRFTVTLAIYETPMQFYLAGIVPLVLGLGLAAFGVALAVADVEPGLVRTTATWCAIGAAMMLVLVLLTVLGSAPDGMPAIETLRSHTYLSNFLIGGSVGGTLTGLYAARSRRQRRELAHQANRLEVLNRILRHEVLNALTAIRGYATLPEDTGQRSRQIVEDSAASIERTIEEVKYLARSARMGALSRRPVGLVAGLEEAVSDVREAYPDAEIAVEVPSDDPAVLANERLSQVFAHLLENAVQYSSADDPTVSVSVATTATTVRVRVADDGPGLPDRHRNLLETGAIERFDDPNAGYGLNVVRLLVESYRGAIEVDADGGGTAITVVLPRETAEPHGLQVTPTGLPGVRPALPHLVVTLAAAMVAGAIYGLVAEGFGGSIAFIGVYYGVQDAVVGWITHEFHSAVFAFVFAGIVSLAPTRYRNHVPAYVTIGIAWGLVLWFLAAGVVSPIWLRLLGIPANIPSLSFMMLVSHLAWGATLGALIAVGYEHATPGLARIGERLAHRRGRSA